ncbi:MAG: tetratricopeptide repeat protein [Microcoleaceae cyanobacterium]
MVSLDTPQPQQSATDLAQAALSYQRQEKWREAAQCYQQALLLRPEWPEVHYRLGVVLEKLDDLAAATQCYRRAIAHLPDYTQAYYKLGAILQKQGQLQEAIEYYQQAIQLDPTEPNFYNNLGNVLTKQGQFDSAIELLKGAIERFPENAVLYNNLAHALFTQGKLDQAIDYYLQAVQLDGGLIKAKINLGAAFQRQGLHTVAIRYFQQVLEQKSDSIQVRSQYGRSLLEQNKIPEALQQFRLCIAQQPEFVEAYIEWLDVIEDTDELNRSRIACGHFLQALLEDINSPDVYHNLAKTYFYLGNALIEYRNYAQAEAYYQKAIKIQPNWLDPYLHLGRCFAKQAQLSAAITTYREGLLIQPDSVELKQQLEQTIQQQQQLKEDAGKLTQNSVKLPADAPITNSHLPACAGLECQPCLNRLFGNFEPINLGDGIYRCSQKPPYLEQNPPNKVAIIPQGRTWIAPRKNWWNVCNAIATIHPNDQLDTTFSRFYPAPLPNCQNPDFSQHQVFFLDEFPALKYLKGKIAVLSGLSGNVYFHWMVDVLPRLEILKKLGIDLSEIDGFVVNSIQRPFQRETLEKLGIPLSKIIETDQQSHLQAEELIVPAFASNVGWVSPWIIQFHRQLFATAIEAPDVDYPERIYITRKKAQYRRIFNEKEVIDCLKQHGFETVALETISVEQQAALFAHAKVIIAPHGAGLTNLMFCRPETQVIELISPHYLRFYYWTIAIQLGLEFYYILGDAFKCSPLRSLMYQNPLTEDIFVSIESLKKALQRLGLSDNIKSSLNSHNADLTLERFPSQAMVMASSKFPEFVDQTFSDQAKAYLKQGNIDAAYKLCIEALQKQPDFAPAYKFLGDAFRYQKRWEESRKSYGQAIRLQPDYAEAHTNLGSLYAGQKQWQKAIFCYQNGIAYQPESAEIYRNLARVWEKVNRAIEAADCWYEVYRLEPESVSATDHCQLGERLLQQGQITKAIFCFEQALQQDNTIEAAQIGLRQAQERRQPMTVQQAATQQAAILPPQPTIDTEEIVTVETLPQESAALNPAVNQILEKAIDLEQPSPQTDEALPTTTESPQLDGATEIRQAEEYYQNQQYESTVKLAEQILSGNPSPQQAVETHVLLGKALQGMGQTQQAMESYKAAIASQPGNITAYNNLGSCYALQKQWNNARACYQKAIQLQPDLAVAYQNLGRVWKRMGQPEKAADCFYQAFQIEPELGGAEEYHALGNTLLQQGKREQAQNCYCRTLDLNPDHPEAHHNLGELLSTQKQWEDAMAHYRRAIELKPESFASYNSLGKAYMAMGDLEEALSCYNQAVRLKPELLFSTQNLTSATATAQSKPTLAAQLPAPRQAQPTEETPSQPLVMATPQFDVMGRLSEAESYYLKQRYDLCIHACRQVVQWQPKAAGAYLLWGKALSAQGDDTRAYQFYQQAVALQPKDPEAYIELGNLYAGQQQWQEAVAQYQTALQQQPTASAYRQLSKAYHALGKVEPAQMSLYEALHLEPETGSLQDYQALAAAFWKREEWTPAMGCYQQILVRDPGQAIAHQRLAEGFQQAGELDKAIIHYRQAYEIVASRQPEAVQPLPAPPSLEMPEDGEMAMLLVHVPSFTKKGKWLLGLLDRMKWATILAWGKPEEFPSFNPDTSHQTVLSEVPQLPPLPQQLIAASQPVSSVSPILPPTGTPTEIPDRKIVPFPNKAEAVNSNPDSILRQALVDLNTGHWQECLAACRQVLAQNPKQVEAYKLLGKVLQAQGQIPQALQAYGNAMALQPLDVDVKVSMGELFVQQQQWNKAIACYQAAVKQNPGQVSVWEKLGDIWARHSQVENALAAYKQVIQLAPQHLPAYQKLGHLLQQQGQIEAANAVYQKAKQLDKQ